MNIREKAKSCLWTFAVPFFALLGFNIYGVSTYELSVEQNNQCMVINLLKDTKEVGRADLLYQDQANAKFEIKKQPAEKNKTPRVVQLNKDVPRPSSIKATRKFVNNKFAKNGFVVEPIGDNTIVKLSLQDNNNILEAEIDGNGVIKVERGQLEDKFIIRGEYAHVLVPQGKTLKGKNLTLDVHTLLNDGLIQCDTGSFGATYLFENKGKLITEGNCTLRMPKSFFRNTGYEGSGVLHVKGSLLFEGDSQSTFDNRAGTITVDKNAMVEAGRFINERLPKRKEYDKPVTSFQKCVKDDGIEICSKQTCENSHEVEGSKAATINCYGSFTLVTSHGVNRQGVIHANGPISITATTFTNQQGELVTLTCNASLKKLFEPTSILLPASITSNDSIDFLLKGMRYVHVRGALTDEQAKNLPGLINNGHIRAKEDVTASVHPNNLKTHVASVINGGKPSVNKPVPTFEYKGEAVSLVPTTIQKALPEAQPSPKNVYFRYVSSLNEVSHPIGMNEIVFKQGVLPKLKPTSKFLFSYQLQAQLLTQILYEQTTAPFLQHVNNDALAQFALLKEMGFLYGLVHGVLRELPNVPKSTIEVFISDYDKQRLKEALRLFADKDQKITIKNLENRLKQIRAGTHILVLPEDKIVSAPQSFLYYDSEKEDIVPFVHVSKEDFKDNAHGDGEMRAKNVFLHTPIVVNTGSIVALNKVEIKALSFKNQRPVLKKINNHTTRDMWSNYHTYQYEIRTPQPGGQVLGFIVEVEVPDADNSSQLAGHKGIQNKGGTIEGTCKVLLIAKQGNIENRHVLGTKTISLDHGFLASASGKSSKSLVHDFHAGQISSSNGDVELVSETGKVLNIASDVIANNSVKIKGYNGVLLKTLTEPYMALSGSKLNGLTYNEVEAEAFTVGVGRVIARKGNIILESEDMVKNKGAYTESGQDTFHKGKKGNKIEAITVSTKALFYSTNLLLPLCKTENVYVEHVINPEVKAGGLVHLDTELDNVIQAAIMTDVGAIYLTAGQDNIIKGAQAKTTKDTEIWKLGISFFGFDALSALSGLDTKGALWSLAHEDPLVRSLFALYKEAHENGHYGIAGAKTSIEVLRLLTQYKNNAQSADPSILKMLGQRLGVTNEAGGFSLSVTFRGEHTSIHETNSETHATEINTEKLVIKNGRDTKVLDGTQIEAEHATVDAGRDFIATGTTDTKTMKGATLGVRVGIGPQGVNSAGGDVSKENAEQAAHTNGVFHAKTLEVNTGRDLRAENVELSGDNSTFNVQGTFEVKSTADTGSHTKQGVSATVGFDGAVDGGFENFKQSTKTVNTPSSIHFKHVEITADKLNLDGAYITSEDTASSIKARLLEYANIDESNVSKGWRVYVAHTPVDQTIDGIHTTFEIPYDYQREDGITRATISENIAVETESDISNLNRDANKVQERYGQRNTSLGVFIPLIDGNRFSDNLNQLHSFFTGKNTQVTEQEAANLVEELLLSDPAEQEKQLREKLKAQVEEAEIQKIEEMQKHSGEISEEDHQRLQELTESREIYQEAQLVEQQKQALLCETLLEVLDEKAANPEFATIQEEQDIELKQSLDEQAANAQSEEKPQIDFIVAEAKTDDGGTIEIRATSLQDLEGSTESSTLSESQRPHIVNITTQQGNVIITLRDVQGNVYEVKSTYRTLNDLLQRRAEFFAQHGVPFEFMYNEMGEYTSIHPYDIRLEDLVSGKVHDESHWRAYGVILLSLALDCVPYVGGTKSAYEAWSGYELLSKEKLGIIARSVAVAGIAFPILNKLRKVKFSKVIKLVKEFGEEAFKDSKAFKRILLAAKPGFIKVPTGSAPKLFELLKGDISEYAIHGTFKRISKHKPTGYWWSRDLDRHGGSCWKVFKEESKGLQWIGDADEFGRLIASKHKGPKGQFIPWKELRRRSL